MDDYKGAPALDAGLVAAAQAVEHYEIARYGQPGADRVLEGADDAAALLSALRIFLTPSNSVLPSVTE